jgi:hypothetical protein
MKIFYILPGTKCLDKPDLGMVLLSVCQGSTNCQQTYLVNAELNQDG